MSQLIDFQEWCNADLRNALGKFATDSMSYYEVTREGKVIKHFNSDWKMKGFTLSKNSKLIRTI